MGLLSPIRDKNIAKSEVSFSLNDLFSACNYLVQYKGKVVIVHYPPRLIEILETAIKYNFKPQFIQFIHHNTDKIANSCLILFRKSKKQTELKVLPPIFSHFIKEK